MFLKLTYHELDSREEVYVARDKIVKMSRDSSLSYTTVSLGNSLISVVETPEEIIAMIDKAENDLLRSFGLVA